MVPIVGPDHQVLLLLMALHQPAARQFQAMSRSCVVQEFAKPGANLSEPYYSSCGKREGFLRSMLSFVATVARETSSSGFADLALLEGVVCSALVQVSGRTAWLA